MEPAPLPLKTLSTAVITLGGDIAWTVDRELAEILEFVRPRLFPTLSSIDWPNRTFTFHGGAPHVSSHLLIFHALCRQIDRAKHVGPCDSTVGGAVRSPPGGEVLPPPVV